VIERQTPKAVAAAVGERASNIVTILGDVNAPRAIPLSFGGFDCVVW